MEHIISLNKISKHYKFNKNKIQVLDNLTVNFENGKFYVIIGRSGSGKSTLINILGLIDNPDSGDYLLLQRNVSNLSEKEKDNIRASIIGFVFQDFGLVDTLTAQENVMLPMMLNKNILRKDRKDFALELLNTVNLQDRASHYPCVLSGGEQQRVSIARAIANDPQIILADEPTGNLDKKSETEVFKILKELTQIGKCVIMVSHSESAKKYADVVYELNDGKLKKVKK